MSRKLNKREFFKYSLGGGSLILTGGLASCSGFAGSNKAQSRFAHPWWVEEVEKPLLAVDNGVYKRFESKNNVFGSFAKYVGPTKVMNLRRIRKERTEEYFAENRPGFRIEDRAPGCGLLDCLQNRRFKQRSALLEQEIHENTGTTNGKKIQGQPAKGGAPG